jgi:hypothetical protein
MNKIVLLLTPILVLAGAVGGLGYVAILDVPFVTPDTHGKPVPASQDTKGGLLWTLAKPVQRLALKLDAAAKVATAKPPPSKKDLAPKTDPEKGAEKLAELWNGVEPENLAKITSKWQMPALARVLLKMDPDAVTKFLDGLDEKRADVISRAIASEASKIPVPTVPAGT